MICEATRMLGSDLQIDQRLIDMLNAILKLPDVTDSGGVAIGPGYGYDGVYRKDLLGLAMMFTENSIGTFSALFEIVARTSVN